MPDDIEVLGAGELLVTGPAVLWFATLAEQGVQVQRRNGVRSALFDRWLTALIEASRRTRSSGVGTTELPMSVATAQSGPIDPVTAQEAAAMLGTSDSYVTRLCRGGRFETAQTVAGRWLIERSEVAARAGLAA